MLYDGLWDLLYARTLYHVYEYTVHPAHILNHVQNRKALMAFRFPYSQNRSYIKIFYRIMIVHGGMDLWTCQKQISND